MNFIPGWNSFRDEIMLVYGEMSSTKFTRFCRYEIWSFQKDRDEIWYRDEKRKKYLPTLRPGMEFYNVFITFFTHVYSIYFATLTCLNIIKVRRKML